MTNTLHERILKGVRKVSPSIKPGDYVFACHWGDALAGDPWYVGFVQCVIHYSIGYRVRIKGDQTNRDWRRAKKITKEQGEYILKNFQ